MDINTLLPTPKARENNGTIPDCLHGINDEPDEPVVKSAITEVPPFFE